PVRTPLLRQLRAHLAVGARHRRGARPDVARPALGPPGTRDHLAALARRGRIVDCRGVSVRACADRGRLCACQFAAAGADRSRRAVDGMGRRERAVGLRAADAARAPSGLAMTTRGTPTDDGAVVESGPPPPAGFVRVARIYHALERLAFGRALERARFALLPALAGCRDVLVLGDGDGR